MLICVIFTLVAQVILTVRFVASPFARPCRLWSLDNHYFRIYAITMKHRIITGCFFVAIMFQLGLGVFMTYLAVKHSGTCCSFRVHLGSRLM